MDVHSTNTIFTSNFLCTANFGSRLFNNSVSVGSKLVCFFDFFFFKEKLLVQEKLTGRSAASWVADRCPNLKAVATCYLNLELVLANAVQ